MIKNLIIFIICLLVIPLTVRAFNKIEAKLNETYGWKTDLLFGTSTMIAVISSIGAFYFFCLFLHDLIFILLFH